MTSYAKIAAWFFLLWVAVGLPATVLGDEPKPKPKPKLPRVSEEIIQVPIKVRDLYHKNISQDITVTVFEAPGRDSYPLLIINHGRQSIHAVDRATPSRWRLLGTARHFASLGFSVWIPTRAGYGQSDHGDDPEYADSCRRAGFDYALEAAAEQVRQVIDVARQRPHIDATRIVIIGQSVGGAATIAAAAKNLPGVVAAVNFAGGHGGRHRTHPGEPCQPHVTKNIFGTYGKMTKVPTLWIYTENDQYISPRHSRSWFESFSHQGGNGTFLMLPPFEDDGHRLFYRGIKIWRPIVGEFLKSVGFEPAQSE